jgi:hypothetical protein
MPAGANWPRPRNLDSASRRRSVEVIVRGVTAPGLGVAVGGVAALGRWLATVSVNALDVCHFVQQTNSAVAGHGDQKPGDGVRVGRINVCCGFARNRTAICQLPGGPGGMMPDDMVISIVKLGVRSLEDPGEFAVRSSLTAIDLRSRGAGRERDLDSGRSTYRFRHLRREVVELRGGGSRNEERHSDGCEGGQAKSSHQEIVARAISRKPRRTRPYTVMYSVFAQGTGTSSPCSRMPSR